MEIRRKIKILICLCITCALLICIDSYYRESDTPYKEMYPEEHRVAVLDTETETHNAYVAVYEFDHLELGDYYRIDSAVALLGHSSCHGTFRVFKEDGIEYEKPVIVGGENSCKVIFKRKNYDDLVYIIPYEMPAEEM